MCFLNGCTLISMVADCYGQDFSPLFFFLIFLSVSPFVLSSLHLVHLLCPPFSLLKRSSCPCFPFLFLLLFILYLCFFFFSSSPLYYLFCLAFFSSIPTFSSFPLSPFNSSFLFYFAQSPYFFSLSSSLFIYLSSLYFLYLYRRPMHHF